MNTLNSRNALFCFELPTITNWGEAVTPNTYSSIKVSSASILICIDTRVQRRVARASTGLLKAHKLRSMHSYMSKIFPIESTIRG